MSMIDREQIAAVKVLQGLGWQFDGSTWVGPSVALPVVWDVTDTMHGLLVMRADALAGCTEGSPEADELEAVNDAIDAYGARRWP